MESADSESRPPSRNLHWFFLAFGGALLVILLVSGILSVRFVRKMHAQELALTQALAQRAECWTACGNRFKITTKRCSSSSKATGGSYAAPSQAAARSTGVQIDSYFKRYPVERDSSEELLLDGLRALFLQQRTVLHCGARSKSGRTAPRSPRR